MALDPNIAHHPLFREVERLFDNSKRSFEGVEFMLYTAAHITKHAREIVTFVPDRLDEAHARLAGLRFVLLGM
jgi:hypothetical protein